jgi:hypothetical protein
MLFNMKTESRWQQQCNAGEGKKLRMRDLDHVTTIKELQFLQA